MGRVARGRCLLEPVPSIVIAATGNHEYYPGPELSKHWDAQFEYPANGPEGADLGETVYSVDYQGVRFITLNSTQAFDPASLSAQTEWLEGQLAENPNTWTVVAFHHPVFSVTSGRDNAVLREAWMPMFEKYGVDLVVQGHDHAYGRGNLIANEKNLPAGADPAKSHTGPVYLVSVAGPKMYIPDPEDANNWTANDANLRVVGRDVQLFQTVDVTDDEFHVEARTVDGALFDSFTIEMAKDGSKLVSDDTAWAAGPGSTRDGLPGATDPVDPVDPVDRSIPSTRWTPSTRMASRSPSPPHRWLPARRSNCRRRDSSPAERASIELHSTPVQLAVASSDADGALAATVRIPADTAPGEHEIVVTGLGSDATGRIAIIVTQPSDGGGSSPRPGGPEAALPCSASSSPRPVPP